MGWPEPGAKLRGAPEVGWPEPGAKLGAAEVGWPEPGAKLRGAPVRAPAEGAEPGAKEGGFGATVVSSREAAGPGATVV